MLIAGIGNIFLGDDGFGPEVVRRLPRHPRPGVRAVDYGIRGMHLAYDLLDRWDALVLIDAVPDRGAPGRLTIFHAACAENDAVLTPQSRDEAGAVGAADTAGVGAGAAALYPDGRDAGRTDHAEPSGHGADGAAFLDAHAMTPDAVFAGVRALGGVVPPTVVVGCQIACVEEGIGLSEPVAAAVDHAVVAVGGVLADLLPPPSSEPAGGHESPAMAREED